MKLVWFSWKDIKHPQAGGAETVSWEIMKRLVRDGHKVRLITSRYDGSSENEVLDGVEIFRVGGRLGVYPKARRLFKKKMSGWTELVIDEMNTLPFGAAFYSRTESVLLTYQLARKVWFYQAVFPVSLAGYLLEPLYLFILSRKYQRVVTESESTKQDLGKYGFRDKNVAVFRVGMDLEPLKTLPQKKTVNNVLILGAMRPMKRTLEAVRAFEIACDERSDLKLSLAGDTSGPYAAKVLEHIKKSRHAAAIKVLGRVSHEERVRLMRESSVILATSIKEGWGLVVTEANSQGTPAIAYDADGLRDSVKDGKTGILVKSGDKAALGKAINQLLGSQEEYSAMRANALEDSRQYTFENSYADFLAGAGITGKKT